jgi:hypothetical protein
MLTKISIAFAAALILGTASAALANNSGRGPTQGGFDIGPLGQCFRPPDCGGRHDATVGFHEGSGGFVPPAKHKHRSPH